MLLIMNHCCNLFCHNCNYDLECSANISVFQQLYNIETIDFTPIARNLVNMYSNEQQLGCTQQKDMKANKQQQQQLISYKQLCMIQARENFLTFPNTRLGRLVPFSTFSSLL